MKDIISSITGILGVEVIHQIPQLLSFDNVEMILKIAVQIAILVVTIITIRDKRKDKKK